MRWLTYLDKPFVLCIGSLVVSTWLRWYDKLDSGSYVAITMGTTGAYIAAWGYKQTKGTPAERAEAATP